MTPVPHETKSFFSTIFILMFFQTFSCRFTFFLLLEVVVFSVFHSFHIFHFSSFFDFSNFSIFLVQFADLERKEGHQILWAGKSLLVMDVWHNVHVSGTICHVQKQVRHTHDHSRHYVQQPVSHEATTRSSLRIFPLR